MLRIGFNLWYRDSPKVREVVAKAVAIGMNHGEISIDYPFGMVEVEPFEEMAKIVRENGMTVSVHAPWQELNIASPIEEIRRASVEVLKRVLKEAYRVEALHVVVHVTSEQACCRRKPYVDRCIDAATRSLEELVRFAEDLGLTIMVENVSNAPCCGRIDQISEIISRVNGVYLCLDVAHAITSDKQRCDSLENVDYADVVSEWSSAVGVERIAELHVHGVKRIGRKIEVHLDLDGVKMDIKRILKTLGRNLRFVVFEVFRSSAGSRESFDIEKLVSYVREFRSWATAYSV